jgi:hypothetical protein
VLARIRDGHYSFLAPRYAARLTYLYVLDRRGRGCYRMLSEEELLATRTSDTAFVFGSGRSLLDIAADEWGRIARCNTISMREFPRQHWVRADYHVTGEVDFIDEYAQRLRENPLYAGTVFVVQGGWRAERGNELVGRRLLRQDAPLIRFRRLARGVVAPPSESLRRGLVHGFNSIFDATNLAVLLGFRRIVLAGVDLYDKGYFWLPPGEGRTYEKPGVRPDEQFGAAESIVRMMGDWCDLLTGRGVEIAVQNPNSLLARRLPVFAWTNEP